MSLPEARRLIAAARSALEPWQRDDATVDHLDGVAAIAAEGAAAVYRMEGERVDLLQAGGEGAGGSPPRSAPAARSSRSTIRWAPR